MDMRMKPLRRLTEIAIGNRPVQLWAPAANSWSGDDSVCDSIRLPHLSAQVCRYAGPASVALASARLSMCGRFALTLPPEAMRRLFGYAEQPNFPPRWNIAPTQPVAVVFHENGGRHFRLMRWGFIPGWTRDPGEMPLMINARAETAAGKPSFRAAMRHRRCLIPASGFYEWRGTGTEKVPFFIHSREAAVLAIGAIWECYLAVDGSEIDTVAILTSAANRPMRTLHDRMPVIISEPEFDLWLDPMSQQQDILPLLGPAAEGKLQAVPVSSRVNAVRNDDENLVAPLGEALSL